MSLLPTTLLFSLLSPSQLLHSSGLYVSPFLLSSLSSSLVSLPRNSEWKVKRRLVMYQKSIFPCKLFKKSSRWREHKNERKNRERALEIEGGWRRKKERKSFRYEVERERERASLGCLRDRLLCRAPDRCNCKGVICSCLHKIHFFPPSLFSSFSFFSPKPRL